MSITRAAATDAAVEATPCPRCQQPLADPHGLGWCQACGYCRSLEEAPVPEAAVEAGEANGALPLQALLPRWAAALLIGVIVVALGSWLISHHVALKPLTRAVWATVQIVVGVLMMASAQSYALFRIAPEEATLHAVDAVVPFRLYGMIFKRLPQLGSALCIAGWGLALTLSALLLVGGLGHWLTYLPKSQDMKQTSRK
jgi:hypothetical protein